MERRQMAIPILTLSVAASIGGRVVRGPFIRSIEGVNLLEIFFVTAVASVLGIRFFLKATGYPQLSGSGLHIAHVLVGGAFMLLAIGMLLAYTNKSASYTAAILGGFGFGAFIDELGKFLTGDSNYFFRPTVALIYVIFVLIYLAIEAVSKRPFLSPQERLINALEITKEAVLSDMDPLERKRALELIEGCDPSDPIAKALKEVLHAIEISKMPEPGIYSRAKDIALQIYLALIEKSWFTKAVVALFIVESVLAVLAGFAVVVVAVFFRSSLPEASFIEVGALASGMLSATFAAAGVIKMRRSKIQAYNLFKMAVLVQILLVQVFWFYLEQMTALVVLFANIIILLGLRYMISHEKGTPPPC
jgi:hypothetical protein